MSVTSINPHSHLSNASPYAVARANAKAVVPFGSQIAAGDVEPEGRVPPVKAARSALETRSDLADRPFGAIVSLLARHQELPAAGSTETTETEEQPPLEGDEAADSADVAQQAPIDTAASNEQPAPATEG